MMQPNDGAMLAGWARGARAIARLLPGSDAGDWEAYLETLYESAGVLGEGQAAGMRAAILESGVRLCVACGRRSMRLAYGGSHCYQCGGPRADGEGE